MLHTLYGSRGSGSAAVEMALRAADLEYQVVRASEWEPDSAMPELKKINPLGQIPTLVTPSGAIVTESAAILIHLGLEHPKSNLLARESSARAAALRGLVFIAANCYPAVSIIDYPARWTTATTKPAQERVRTAGFGGSSTSEGQTRNVRERVGCPRIASEDRTGAERTQRSHRQRKLTAHELSAALKRVHEVTR